MAMATGLPVGGTSVSSRHRILIDGTMARGGGGFTYLVNILPQLAQLAPEDEYRVLLRSEAIRDQLDEYPNLRIDLLPSAGMRERLRFTFFELPRLARRWRADLLFSAGETVPPVASCPRIASFRNPNVCSVMAPDFGWAERPRLATLKALAKLSSWSSERVVFVSEDSAQWMGDSLRLPERQRAVVHHGIDASRWQPVRKRAIPARGYILSVSSLYRYKNFSRLIDAYSVLAERRPEAPDLVIIGDDQQRDCAAEMEAARDRSGVAERIHILGHVPYPDVAACYEGADLFVFPSYRETFGFPLLEAMAMEVPVVAADIPTFREVGGDAAFFADPHSSESFADAMETALYRATARDVLIKRGRERVRQFTWQRSATRLQALFEAVLAERARAAVRVPAIA